MFRIIYRSTIVTLILAVVLCGAYPLAVTLVGKLLFREKANGSIVFRDGKAVGSSLIGQGFSRPEYFHGRPSSAGEKGYDAANSSGSNLGPTNTKLVKAVEANIKAVRQENPGLEPGQVPVDLVTASGSGLDPHISIEAALVQVSRVAKARMVSTQKIRAIVEANTEGRQLGFLGEPVVNVLAVNLALDETIPVSKQK
jgi:K+-transporting ATPase ATPase C chain